MTCIDYQMVNFNGEKSSLLQVINKGIGGSGVRMVQTNSLSLAKKINKYFQL